MNTSLSAQQRALVAQIFETGARTSVERLTQLSNTPWIVISSNVEMMTIAGALSAFQSDAIGYLAAHLRAQPPQSPVPLECLVMFPRSCVHPLAEAVTAKSARLMAVPDRINAVISEVANILGQSVVKALADKLGASIILSVPQVLLGSTSEILSKTLSRVGGKNDAVILTYVELRSETLSAACSMILVFDVDILRRFPSPSRLGL